MSRRWSIAILITAAIAISYFDRQTLPVAEGAIREEMPISDVDFGRLVSVFYLSYALMYLGGGKLVDVLGTRRAFFWTMVLWSLACASHGLAHGLIFLAVCRFLLGLGEGGGIPAATKAVSEWFPVRERSSAIGLFNAGTAIGAVAAAPAVAAIIAVSNWRWPFFVAGAMGIAWTAWWLKEYYPPAEDERLSPQEREEIKEVFDQPTPLLAGTPWLRLLRLPQVWGLVLAKFLSDSAWFYYSQWLPKYLRDIQHFDIKQVGYFSWIPYAAAGIGSLLGGGFSAWLLTRGYSVNFSRKVVLGLSAACMPWVFLVTRCQVSWAIVLFSLAFFGQQSWSTLVMTLPVDMFPRSVMGSVAGMIGFGGAMGGVIFNLIAGGLLDELGRERGYVIVFALTSSFHIVAFILILATVRRVQPVEV